MHTRSSSFRPTLAVRSGVIARLQRAAGSVLALLPAAALALAAGTAAAAQVDLSVSSYSQTPDPVARSGVTSFSAIVTNNDNAVSASGTIALTIDLPSNIDFSASAAPDGCSFAPAAAPTALNCSRSGLAAASTWPVAFSGLGKTAGAVTTRAAVAFTSVDADDNAGNDVLVKNITVINGADLAVKASGASGVAAGCTTNCSAAAGAIATFTLDTSNAGPDAASSFHVVVNLPAASDFTYTSATGSGWVCAPSGVLINCDYRGAAVGLGQHAPPITVGGRLVKALAGTVTLGATVATSDALTGDPQAANDGPSQVVVNVIPGTDLVAHQSLISNATGQTTLVAGEPVTLTLSGTNTGTQDASGVTLRDTIPAGLTIGALPPGCAASGQVLTCNVGPLAHGATSPSFSIPLTVAAGAVSSTNLVDIARSAPTDGNNTPASVSYTVGAPFAHLTLTKSKGPALVGAGRTITSTIVVTNSTASTSAASGTVRVTDTLSANELYQGVSSPGWSCTAAGTPQVLTCDYAITGSLARGAALPPLLILTKAADNYTGPLSNTGCTGLTAGSPHQPADNSATGNCATSTVTATSVYANLAIQKTSSVATLPYTSNSFSYTLTISNAGPNTAPTVTVTDALPAWFNGNAGITTGSAVLAGAAGGEACNFNSTVTCTIRNLALGATRTVTITVNRPMQDGSFTNLARVASQDAIDEDPSDNVDSVPVAIEPLTDVTITSMAGAPNPVKVGVALRYTTSIKNNGPSTAAGVVLRQRIDPARMSYVAGSASIAGSAANCVWVDNFAGAPYAGGAGIECSGFSLANAEARQLVLTVVPVYPYPDALDATYTSDATISTTANESNTGNNTRSVPVTITNDELDLTVTDADIGSDPTSFGDALLYQVKVQNNGPSRATRFKLTVVPVPPPQGAAAAPYTMNWNSAGSTLPAGASCSQPGGQGTSVVCYLAATPNASLLASGDNRSFALKFDTGPASNAPAGSLTYQTRVAVESYETGPAPYTGDTLPANNQVAENTTVLPKADLAVVSKTVSAGSPFGLNQPFTYTVTVANMGPSRASGVKVTDVLPAGLVLTGTPVASLGSGTLSTNSCTSSGTPVTISCTLGTLPVAAGAADTANLVRITIPVKAAWPTYTGPFGSNLTNTATIAPLPGTTRDPFAGNDSASVVVQIVKSSIAGSVYNDINRNNLLDGGEKIAAGVSFALFGKDFWNNDIGTAGAPVTVSSSGGDFLFDRLPRAGAAGYTIVQTQPANYADRYETAGTAGGQVPPAVCDGVQNCAAGAAQNSIAQIALGQGVQASGYLFQEYGYATVSGYVYADANNDGQHGAGETGLPGVTLKIAGTTYAGADLCATLGAACSATTNAAGLYTFLVPSGANYTVSEQTLPAGYFDGKDQNGSGAANVLPASAGRAAPEAIVIGQVDPGTTYAERNFGELPAGSIAGNVYIDSNGDAVRQPAESAGVPGVTVTIGGNDYRGVAVCPSSALPSCSVPTNGTGAYLIGGLPPSDAAGYSVTETAAAGLSHTGTQAGSLGGVINGAPRAANAGVTGAAVKSASGIVLAPGATATGYNFGEQGQGIAGFVYADMNRDGVKGAGEPGIAGVTVTLSGSTVSGANVCSVLPANACVATTGADGSYSFIAVPQSNPAGYTIKETQPAAYIDGGETLGSISGAGSANGAISGAAPVFDQFSGLVLPVGGFATNYNFGEWAGSISGTVYLDIDGNGANNTGDTPLAGVTITLGGAGSATTVTDAAGNYHFDGLSPGSYSLTETQPVNYADGATTAGAAGGTAASGTSITGVNLTLGGNATGYLFGEKGGTLTGSVYIDLNDNGLRDAAETRGLGGVTITVSGVAADGVSVINRQATTGADGSYRFAGLPSAGPAGYTLVETQPPYPDGKQRKGLINGAASCANPQCDIATANTIARIPFDAAKSYTLFDFGELLGANIGGTVYLDANDNGLRDVGEPPLAGVVLTLTQSNGPTLVRNVSTGADGSYLFDGLSAGTYQLVETQPSTYLDGRETVGSAGGTVDNSAFDDTARHNTIAAISVTINGSATGNLFGERYANGALAGHVYVDTNRDGVMNASETGIANVALQLTGAAADGTALSLSATSAADGSYSFPTVPASGAAGYTLSETQPAGYTDGLTTLTLNANGKATSAKPVGAGNTDLISGVKVVAGDKLDGFLFGENPIPALKTPIINGYVWLDRDHSRERPRDGTQTGLSGWSVQLRQGEQLICTVSTDDQGYYAFDNLHCAGYQDSGLPTGAGFSVTFQKDGNNLPNVPVSTGNAGVVVPGISRIAQIVLAPGAAVVEQNLPLDPAGVVYDSVTRKPVNGASISISGPAGFDPAQHLVGGAVAQTQVVGADGMYQFLLKNTYPSGVYTLSVVAPASYMPGASVNLPPCATTLNLGATPNPALVQASDGAPGLNVKAQLDPRSCVGIVAGGAQSTQYYTAFSIVYGSSAPIVNNHIPLDPLSSSTILVSKTTPMVNVSRGDLVPYTITATNTQAVPIGALLMRDQIPPGFKFRAGSAMRNGVPFKPEVDGRTLTWAEPGFAAKEKKTYTMMLMVGSGVGDGEYTNQAWVDASLVGPRISNLASATVRVTPDPTFDCPDIIGKVFDDRNANGYQDDGEPGLPGVRMATTRGLLVTSDAQGRFHVACPDIPNADRGSNFVMKLDERTLPSGYRVTTENPRDIRLTRGKVSKLNFGATVHRVVRIELTDAAFQPNSTQLLDQWQQRLDGLMAQLQVRPSVVRIAYVSGNDAASLARQRSVALEGELRRRWHDVKGAYPLDIETEESK